MSGHAPPGAPGAPPEAPHRAAIAVVCLLAALLAGCRNREPAAQPTQGPEATGQSAPAPAAAPPAAPPVASSSSPATAALDPGALSDRSRPDALVRYYAAALEQGRWSAAARAWRSNSGVTADTLKASYDRGQALSVTVGKGRVEGAAGSLYYDVPVTLRFGGGAPQQGSLTLRRVNDVPGATAEQLDWRIERSTIGAGQ